MNNNVRPMGTIGLLPMAEAWVRESNDEQVARARAIVEFASDLLLAAGLRVSTGIQINKGRPQDVLSDEARKWEADCIVVGARGLKRPHDRFRTGRIATALVMHAPCSIEVVRVRDYDEACVPEGGACRLA